MAGQDGVPIALSTRMLGKGVYGETRIGRLVVLEDRDFSSLF
jgi:hypothetical protein